MASCKRNKFNHLIKKNTILGLTDICYFVLRHDLFVILSVFIYCLCLCCSGDKIQFIYNLHHFCSIHSCLEIVNFRDGDWWLARHMSTNVSGYIPNNYVAAVNAIEQHE